MAPAGKIRKAAVIGMFDGVHLGHRFLINRLKEEAGRRNLTPAVFTFPCHPLAIVNPAKAPSLLTDANEKVSRLTAAGIATENINLLKFDEAMRSMKAAEFMAFIHNNYDVDFILRGFNNRFGTERDLTADDYHQIATDCGIELIDADSMTMNEESATNIPVSSSLIREALLKGNIEAANTMLGYEYQINGTVVGGKRLGHTIGFPTANLSLNNSSKLIPADGVYICVAEINGEKTKAMVNIGIRPTVDGINQLRTIEAHILDFSDDIYGKSLSLDFYHRLRSEIQFSSTDQLIEQLRLDRESTLKYLTDIPTD